MRYLKLVPSRQSPTGDLGSQFWSGWWVSWGWYRPSYRWHGGQRQLASAAGSGSWQRRDARFGVCERVDVLSKPLIGAWICGPGMVSGLLESTARHNELTEWC